MTLLRDPRHYQIAVLSGLLVYGLAALDFDLAPGRAALILAAALLAQLACTRLWRLPAFEPRSALISGLSLCLLLRTNSAGLAVAAAALTIASKFLLRWRGKHLFNPTNFGLVVMLLWSDRVWVSPGQWGSVAFFGFLMAGLGALVVHRAARADVTWAFLACWVALVCGRSLELGEPLAIPLHRLESGALLLFAFFMISDPKTTPDSRAGRVVFAALVAIGAYWVQFRLFRSNALLWSLACVSPFTPLLDRLLPGERYDWRRPATGAATGAPPMPKRRLATAAVLAAGFGSLAGAVPAAAFCGFYVAKADTKLFNRASQVVLVRDGDRTVLTMANDFKGDPKEFAIVVPVPTFLEREQIHVGDKAIIDHLDAYSAPRLVEYFDEDPCRVVMEMLRVAPSPTAAAGGGAERARALGVTIEAQYTVGEYDILILSAKESAGLETWLRESGYRIPAGASAVLGSYLRQNMRFFVAKVNLEEQAKLGFSYLRPLQMAFESPKFMLPIRLGTINADGPQELFVYTLTRKGRVETTNYRTVKLPTGNDVPLFVKAEFGDFYKAMFAEQVRREDMRVVFLEYAWDMNWCDPCAADPLSDAELRDLGVFWVGDPGERSGQRILPPRPPRPPMPQPQAVDVFLTRLHVRYDAAHFPEDLVFQETADRENFQGRYVLRHPWQGDSDCAEARRYRQELRDRQEREAATLASLTGWRIDDIRRKMRLPAPVPAEREQEPWWKRIWDGL